MLEVETAVEVNKTRRGIIPITERLTLLLTLFKEIRNGGKREGYIHK